MGGKIEDTCEDSEASGRYQRHHHEEQAVRLFPLEHDVGESVPDYGLKHVDAPEEALERLGVFLDGALGHVRALGHPQHRRTESCGECPQHRR